MNWWEWTLIGTLAPLPGLLVWRWRVRRARAKAYRESMEYRRAKFGGAISVPGRGVQIIEREP